MPPVPAHKANEYIRELATDEKIDDFRLWSLLREMRVALNTAPDSRTLAHLYTGIGIALAKLGKGDEALEQHANACKLWTTDAVHPNNYAVTLEMLGRDEEALHWYAVAAETPNGYTPRVLANFAMALGKAGLPMEDVRHVFEEAVSVSDPGNLEHTKLLASAAAQLGFREAVVELVARYAALRYGIPLGDRPASDVIARLPSGWWSDFKQGFDVVNAIVQAGYWRGRLDELAASYSRTTTRGSASDRARMDAECFKAYEASRRSATRAGIAEYLNG